MNHQLHNHSHSHLNKRIAVLASGKGSNLEVILQAMQQGSCDAQVSLVICNKADANALQIARAYQVPQVVYLNPKDYADRAAYDQACAALIQQEDCAWVVLAGYMRILSSTFIQTFPQQIINIHPSLLPSFVGAHAVADALAYGVQITGCTVHLVTEDLDSGPILAQTAVPVLSTDDHDTLHQRIQNAEYQLYVQVIQRLVSTPFHVQEKHVIWD
ncbi:MAG: phosphoribosylglycinamide formyltransferase [Mariprofundaceae bacterium]|nr:phosphoribosylglycinamide formyltransferase [Mariprofundaceae bacterium]